MEQAFSQYEVWFVTGAQLLYGGDAVIAVDAHSNEMVKGLNDSGRLPVKVVYKGTANSSKEVEAVMKAVLHTGTTDDLPGVGATREGTRADPPTGETGAGGPATGMSGEGATKAGDLMEPVRDVPPGPATMAAPRIATGLQEMTGGHIRTGMAGAVPRAIPTTRHAVPGSPSGPTAMTA